MPPQQSVRTIIVKASVDGGPTIKSLSDQFGGMNKNLKKSADSLGFFRNALLSVFAYVGVREIVGMADSMQNLTARIRSVTGSAGETKTIMEGLLGAANRTKTSIDGLATIYARLASATKSAHISSGSLLAITETLQNTFRLSGATTQEATNAAIQLAQGFASGQLRGQELRSVLEQNAEFGDILAKSLTGVSGKVGITRGEMYKLAEAGAITNDKVLKAMAENMNEINTRASKMGQTFEQTLTVNINELKVAIGELNAEWDLSGKFAQSIQFIKTNFAELATITIPILAYAFKSTLAGGITAAATALKALSVAMLANPITAGLVLITTSIALLVQHFGGFKQVGGDAMDFMTERFHKFNLAVNKARLATMDYLNIGNKYGRAQILKNIQEAEEGLGRLTQAEKLAKEEKEKNAIFEAFDAKRKEKEVMSELTGMAKVNKALTKKKEFLAVLNAEYSSGKLSMTEYFDKLETLNFKEISKQFKEGGKDLGQVNEASRKLKELNINRTFNAGALSIKQFNEAIKQNNLDGLNEKLMSGKISLIEYNSELIKISDKFLPGSALMVGTTDFLKSIGTVSTDIAGLVGSTFGKLEDSLADFVKTGKFNFNDFAQAVLDDINRIIIRAMIIRPLANAVLSSFGGGGGGGGVAASNAGGSYLGANTKFAEGGIVNKRTNFSYGGGKSGTMGEAGPEAIMPLKRGSDGSLGVQTSTSPVIVNIINNSGAQVEQKETTASDGSKQIEVLIHGKVKEGIASGMYDKTFGQAYGMKRRGS